MMKGEINNIWDPFHPFGRSIPVLSKRHQTSLMNFKSKAKRKTITGKKNQFDDDQIGEKEKDEMLETIRTAHNKRKVLLVYICCGFDNVQKNERHRF